MGFWVRIVCTFRCSKSLAVSLDKQVLTYRPHPQSQAVQEDCLTLKMKAVCSFQTSVDCVWNVMAHAQKPGFVFRRNRRVHLNRRGRQFSRLLAGELCTSACRVCTARASLCSAVMWRLLVTHSILLFPLHFSRASPCAITFQLGSNYLPNDSV